MRRHLVLRVTSKLLMPFILLFALYVQFHGDFGPGGGFQAGVIFGAGFILYTLIYGVERVGQHLGIQLIELGVGITVAATMITIFFAFAGRGRR